MGRIVDTLTAYTVVIALVAVQRLGELVVSRRNEKRLRARGAVEVGAEHYPWMVALHVGFLASCALEPWLLDRPWIPVLGWCSLGALGAAQVVRVWTILALDGRWTVRVIVEPGARAVTRGPFRFMRHPNYVVLVVEIAAIPLIHTAWITAAVFSALNLVMLRIRIRAEEDGLARWTDWSEAFGDRRR